MIHSGQLPEAMPGAGEALLGAPNLVAVSPEDPRTTAQFLVDAIHTYALVVPDPQTGEIVTSLRDKPDFSVVRPSDKKCLDDEIAVAMHDFFIQHAEVTVVDPALEVDRPVHWRDRVPKPPKPEPVCMYSYDDKQLEEAFAELKKFLEDGYGIEEQSLEGLAGPERARAWAANTHRHIVSYACLQATKRALLVRKTDPAFRRPKLNNRSRQALKTALNGLPGGELEYYTRPVSQPHI